jgi:hypothetical protein
VVADPPATPQGGTTPVTSPILRTLWSGDVEDGSLRRWTNQSESGRVQVMEGARLPFGLSHFLRLTTREGDRIPENSKTDPRSQLYSPLVAFPGTERTFRWATRFPDDFPTIAADGRVMFMQLHGAPYTGSPQLAFRVIGERIQLGVNGNNANTSNPAITTPWSAPLDRGHWYEFRLKVRFERSQAGWVELWVDGERQRFANGAWRYQMQTLPYDLLSGERFYLNNYRKPGLGETVVEHAVPSPTVTAEVDA